MRVLLLSGWYCGPEGVSCPGDEIALENSEARALVRAGRAKPLDFEVEPEPEDMAPLRRPVMPIPPKMRKRNRRW